MAALTLNPIPGAPTSTQAGAQGAATPLMRIATHLGYLLCGLNHNVMTEAERRTEVDAILTHSTFLIPNGFLPEAAWVTFLGNLRIFSTSAALDPEADEATRTPTKNALIDLCTQSAALAAIWDRIGLGLTDAQPGTDL